ncbi:uncharacterized protein Tco025E_10067 [Trypanosoma conorhini]|uniref:Uncharacterized protein n=1 Tax=Trypanosoma conorhini TaxID=83891 RepID=A0A422MQ48_9TRYP|nr:uncharacterized protein Tco025E_10067 [Trypanosoma conorhini]RNE95331.1 hypothetical protein Tco025E_10067 [Trypanosoma conorhini]
MQRRIPSACQAIVCQQRPVKPQLKCRRYRNLREDSHYSRAQRAHRHHRSRQLQQQRHLRCKLRMLAVRGTGTPLPPWSSQAVRRVPPEVGSHRQVAFRKLQRHRLTLRLRQQPRQAGRRKEPPPQRRRPAARVLGATRKATQTAVTPSPLRGCVHLCRCCSWLPLPVPVLLRRW